MAGELRRWLRRSVRRAGADSYMRLMLVSFAAVLLGTRVYLALTGYPQVGGEVLHIAHALWGGLLLFVAALLPLLVASRWAYTATALLAGIGAGLFIDEVGKFITQDNDYFFPAAAPIVYAVFLLSVLVYVQVRARTPATRGPSCTRRWRSSRRCSTTTSSPPSGPPSRPAWCALRSARSARTSPSWAASPRCCWTSSAPTR